MASRFRVARSLAPWDGFICRKCLSRSRPLRQPFHTTRSQGQSQVEILDLLEKRGLVHQLAGDRKLLATLLRSQKVGVYAGIDPTASSLHLGHLLPLMVLFWLYHHGHHAVSLVGGATARVGDPSGRLTSRVSTAESVQTRNFESMFAQLDELWNHAIRYGERHGLRNLGTRELLNNAAWLDNLNILDFLRVMGTGARLGAMLGRDTVRNKMEKGDGMSFAEFTYPLLQGWDWWQMYKDKNVQIQVGGGDQYGNIVAGLDAVNYIAQSQVVGGLRGITDDSGRIPSEKSPMGLTVPLLTTSNGEKFGKSAGNAIWLDSRMTSPFDLYGFLLRSTDEDVERYLKLFTFVPLDEISSCMQAHTQDPGKRKAQHLLASEVLELVYGPEEASQTRASHQASRAPTIANLTQQSAANSSTQSTAEDVSRTVLPASLIMNSTWAKIVYHAGFVGTKSEGTRLIAQGGAYVASAGMAGNEEDLQFIQIKDQTPSAAAKFVLDGKLVLRFGKWKVRVVDVMDDAEFAARRFEARGWKDGGT